MGREKKPWKGLWMERAGPGRPVVLRVRLGGVLTYLGTFATVADAAVVRNAWLQTHYGSLAEAWARRRHNWKARPLASKPERKEVSDDTFGESRSNASVSEARVRVVVGGSASPASVPPASSGGSREDTEVEGLLAEIEAALGGMPPSGKDET